MPTINNAQVIQKLVDELKLYPGKDLIPTELAEKILPVFQINDQEITIKTPTANIVRGSGILDNNSDTMFTTPATGKFFLTNVWLQAQDDGSVANGDIKVVLTIDGAVQTILDFRMAGGTADFNENSLALNLQNPILVDQGTNIVASSSTTSLKGRAGIVGYTEAD